MNAGTTKVLQVGEGALVIRQESLRSSFTVGLIVALNETLIPVTKEGDS